MAKTQLHKNLRPQKEKRVYLTHSIFMNGLSDADIKLLKKYNRYLNVQSIDRHTLRALAVIYNTNLFKIFLL